MKAWSEPDAQAQIRALEVERQRALIAVDLQALAHIFDDELVHVHSVGLVHNKAELLTHVKNKRGFVAIERGPLTIRLYGDVAVMTGSMHSQMRDKDGADVVSIKGYVTQVLRRHPDTWRFLNFQLTLLRES